MSRIAGTFERLKKNGRKALIGYLTVGYPTVERTIDAVRTLSAAGCDVVELGIPFSDPLADGATIQRASFQALQNGVSAQTCLDVAAELRRSVDVPLVFMTYYNPVLNYGLDAFCSNSSAAGLDGFIVPDLPPDEGDELSEATRRNALDLIYLLAPTSTEQRIKLVAEKSSGFIYLVSLTGVTGARESLPAEVEEFVARVRNAAKLPLCVGFGISTPDQAERMSRIADGVIVGSKLIELVDGGDLRRLDAFVRSLRERV